MTDFSQLGGWTQNPDEVDAVLATMPQPLFGDVAKTDYEKVNTFLYEIVRKIKGSDLDAGPQGIGDCVSWGQAGIGDTLQCIGIARQLVKQGLWKEPDPEDTVNVVARKQLVATFEEIATEASYGYMRCEIGKQWGSQSDGAVGAWAAKAAQFGMVSRAALIRAGLPGPYSAKRAKEWGAKGLPDQLEPIAKLNPIKNVSLVTTWDEAAAAIVNYQNPISICSNQGFSLKRDAQGFCAPSGTWYHCMKLIAVRFDRPGGLIVQSWGKDNPTGPIMFNQPTNSFWVDASVLNRMLSQKDSFVYSDMVLFSKEVDVPDFSWDH